MPHKGNTQIKVFELQADKVLVVFNFTNFGNNIIAYNFKLHIYVFSINYIN